MIRGVLLIASCVACGGEIESADASACADGEVKTGCPCVTAGTIANDAGTACACASLAGCDGGPRWACYPLAASCPSDEPSAFSSCTTSMTCDYVHADGTATELQCDGAKWDPATITTFCQ